MSLHKEPGPGWSSEWLETIRSRGPNPFLMAANKEGEPYCHCGKFKEHTAQQYCQGCYEEICALGAWRNNAETAVDRAFEKRDW